MSRGSHQLISKFLIKASLDVFKEPPNKSSLQCSKSAPGFSSPDSLATCSFCSLRSQTQDGSFYSFAPGLRKPLGGPADGFDLCIQEVSQAKISMISSSYRFELYS